ncbi:MAG TPA: FGGY-family carbohydrate kinase [Anaerolineaceae bacterium]|nr:FGGY-family carbohydrate kinase [Anaerolineaceae bacterium]
MSIKIISFDLGTGGNKASLYNVDGKCLATAFVPYDTYYPQVGWHEQCPEDWWRAVVESTQELLQKSDETPENIKCLAISGHSLGAVPIDKNGQLVRDATPIWSDIRAQKEVADFFTRVDPTDWYLTTGNGFPAACYTIFKIMWYRNNEPEMFAQIDKILGTKDYINFKLTGVAKTDFSYASGCGVYNLKEWRYQPEFIAASGISPDLFPEIVPSTEILGTLTPQAAWDLRLSPEVKVVCGGVDNSCMALGAKNIKDGRVYTSLGSSAWIAVSSEQPVLDPERKPYVFAHVIPGMFTSAVSIFSAGTSFKWVKENICTELAAEAETTNQDPYVMMDGLAEFAPIGSNKLLFNPSLAGGTSQDASVHIRGAYLGLDLKHGKADLVRAAMEGIAMNLRLRLDLLRKYTQIEDEILFVGGGSKSPLYRRIFADVYNTKVLKTNVDQDAAALGAAAIAAVGCGYWDSFARIDEIHQTIEVISPNPENNRKYEKLLPIFEFAAECQAKISDALHEVEL